MNKVIQFIFGSDPRTTIAGYIGAIAVAVLPALQNGSFTEASLITAAAIAVVARLAKDTKQE